MNHDSMFPQEVYEHVIDHLHDDKAALGVCGRVCRAWVPASRYHLFRKVMIPLDDVNTVAQFLELLKYSTTGRSVVTYIHKVDMHQICLHNLGGVR